MTKDKQAIIFGVLLVIFLTFMIHVLLQSGMSCSDQNGCLRGWCTKNLLGDDYAKLAASQEKYC